MRKFDVGTDVTVTVAFRQPEATDADVLSALEQAISAVRKTPDAR